MRVGYFYVSFEALNQPLVQDLLGLMNIYKINQEGQTLKIYSEFSEYEPLMFQHEPEPLYQFTFETMEDGSIIRHKAERVWE